MGGRAPVTRVVLQFPGWRVTMNNLHRHKNHQQDAQHDCDRLAELGTRSFHVLLCYRVPITRARQPGRNLCLIWAWLRPWNDVPPCGMIKAPYRWDRSRERREREAAQVASFGAYGERHAGKPADWNGRNGQAAKLQDLRPAIGHE